MEGSFEVSFNSHLLDLFRRRGIVFGLRRGSSPFHHHHSDFTAVVHPVTHHPQYILLKQ